MAHQSWRYVLRQSHSAGTAKVEGTIEAPARCTRPVRENCHPKNACVWRLFERNNRLLLRRLRLGAIRSSTREPLPLATPIHSSNTELWLLYCQALESKILLVRTSSPYLLQLHRLAAPMRDRTVSLKKTLFFKKHADAQSTTI